MLSYLDDMQIRGNECVEAFAYRLVWLMIDDMRALKSEHTFEESCFMNDRNLFHPHRLVTDP